MPTTSIRRWLVARVDPVIDPEEISEIPVNLKASQTYPAGTILGEMIGTDEVQTVTIDATGGTFTITFGGQVTAALAWNATAAVVQAALEALSTIGVGNILVTKSGLVYTLTFRAALGSQNVAAVTTQVGSLTGGAGTAAVATATAGVAGTPGLYNAYASGNSDGSQVPKGILRYPCVTDAAGMITVGYGDGQAEWGQQTRSIDMAINGTWRCEDLVGLDTNAVTKLGRLVQGTIAYGRLVIYGGG
jgi:hypothetical protein